MNSQEKNAINKERKQIQAFIDSIRTENESIGKQLAGIISLIGSTRASQLGISIMLDDLQKKLGT